MLLPAQARIMCAEQGKQIGGSLPALGVAGAVALAPADGEGQIEATKQRHELVGEVAVLDRELRVHRSARRRDGTTAEEHAAQKGHQAAMPGHEPTGYAHLQLERV